MCPHSVAQVEKHIANKTLVALIDERIAKALKNQKK
jgi:hypothetical protein